MLTEQDIELIKDTRREVYANRTHDITLTIPAKSGRDPITGNPIKTDPVEHGCEAIVTEVSTSTKADRYLDGGIRVEKGDVLFHVDYDELDDIEADYERVKYRGNDYEIINAAHKGLGEINRIEFLGRLIS